MDITKTKREPTLVEKKLETIILHIIQTKPFKLLPDEAYLKLRFIIRVKRKLNLNAPETFNDKLQWLKLHDRNPMYQYTSNKLTARKLIADKFGEEYLVPLLGVWDDAEDIDFDKLPNQFVLKCNHDSGSYLICKDKNTFNIKKAKKHFKRKLKQNYYYKTREWPYKNIKPKIMCEKYMTDGTTVGLKDYKIFSFHGVPKFIRVQEIGENAIFKRTYDINWKKIKEDMNFLPDNFIDKKPAKFEKMLEMTRVMAEGLIHLRMDFYYVDDKIYFGEMTLYHGSGMNWFRNYQIEKKYGDYLDLSKF